MENLLKHILGTPGEMSSGLTIGCEDGAFVLYATSYDEHNGYIAEAVMVRRDWHEFLQEVVEFGLSNAELNPWSSELHDHPHKILTNKVQAMTFKSTRAGWPIHREDPASGHNPED